MNRLDHQLNRLLKSAARAPAKSPGSAGLFALESRVMNAWRSSARAESGEIFVAWFRRAAIGACLLAAVSLAWSYSQPSARSPVRGISDELAIADSAMQNGLNP